MHQHSLCMIMQIQNEKSEIKLKITKPKAIVESIGHIVAHKFDGQ